MHIEHQPDHCNDGNAKEYISYRWSAWKWIVGNWNRSLAARTAAFVPLAYVILRPFEEVIRIMYITG
jgi:hypothetical protein